MIKYLLLTLILVGCYNERKATQQFAKAAVAYPRIGAEYCSDKYPIKDSLIRDTSYHFDTLYMAGKNDTAYYFAHDTLTRIITKIVPQIITKEIHIVDTIIKENTAAVRLCEIDKNNAIKLAVDQTKIANDFKAKAHKRGTIMWSIIAAIVIGGGLWVYSKVSSPGSLIKFK